MRFFRLQSVSSILASGIWASTTSKVCRENCLFCGPQQDCQLRASTPKKKNSLESGSNTEVDLDNCIKEENPIGMVPLSKILYGYQTTFLSGVFTDCEPLLSIPTKTWLDCVFAPVDLKDAWVQVYNVQGDTMSFIPRLHISGRYQ